MRTTAIKPIMALWVEALHAVVDIVEFCIGCSASQGDEEKLWFLCSKICSVLKALMATDPAPTALGPTPKEA